MTNEASLQDLVDAVRDLTRVTIAISGQFESRADSIRRLSELSIAPVRLAALLGIPPKQVHAELAKAKQRGKKANGRTDGKKR
jgi:hypothetical protein